MKKYDINTRQGRSRRQNNYAQFNPETLLPHTKNGEAVRERRKEKRARRINKSRRWSRILSKGV